MTVRIFSTAAQQILDHAKGEHPCEACGLLVGRDRTIETVVQAANVAPDPARSFEVEPVTLLRTHREARAAGRAVLGWYHSHPDGSNEPSAVDALGAREAGKLWVIVAAGRLRMFVSRPGSPHGAFDEVDWRVV